MKKVLFVFMLSSCISLFSQQKDDVTKYFNQYLTIQDQFALLEQSLPTLEQCEQVFVGDNAKIYFEGIQKIRVEIQGMIPKLESAKMIGSMYTKFTSDKAKKDGYTHGMHKIKDVLKPGVTFYLISYQGRGGSVSKYSPFKFFVKLDESWIFFPKPTLIFRGK